MPLSTTFITLGTLLISLSGSLVVTSISISRTPAILGQVERTRNVRKSKCVELTTSSSTESPPSDNRDLPSTKLFPRSYSRALPPDPYMSKEQKETRGMLKNLGRALHEFAKMLKKECH
ncbi:hypothetical protein Tco_0057999 [Tanacetum coccineum]